MTRMTQQDSLYTAEEVLSQAKSFDSIADIQSYLDGLVDSWWWVAFYPQVERIMVHLSRDDTSFAHIASVQSVNPIGEISMHPNQFTLRTVSHEVAHVFAHRLHCSASHDPWFARERLVTTYCMMGPEAYSDLYASFLRHGIEVANPSTLTDLRIEL